MPTNPTIPPTTPTHTDHLPRSFVLLNEPRTGNQRLLRNTRVAYASEHFLYTTKHTRIAMGRYILKFETFMCNLLHPSQTLESQWCLMDGSTQYT